MSFDTYSLDINVPSLILSLIITIVAYGFFPFFYALVQPDPIAVVKYRRICYALNVPVMIAFMLLKDGASSGAPYFLWTTVFYHIGKWMLRRNGLLSDEDQETDVVPHSGNLGNSTKSDTTSKIKSSKIKSVPKETTHSAHIAPVRSSRKPKKTFPISQILPYIMIAILLICFVIRERQLTIQISNLSDQVAELQSQNETLSQRYKTLSSSLGTNSQNDLTFRRDLVDLDTKFETLLDSMVRIYHTTNHHKDTGTCYYCMVFKLALEGAEGVTFE